ncbi:MAG: tRNA ((37)-N6)-threonylcarbamoyltransferase complex ATPase subunit type 1 TsaE [bacterium]|nr:tRNA ((37)-N6)-threonylcarbamoyltransferase complex ATPase subunit type 1 TsaE [bacterium]
MSVVIDSASHADTQRLGERLGRVLAAGDVVALVGELGAGKTSFVQGLARGLGIAGRVASPSFTIVNEHEGRVPLYHVDFYRLEDADELRHIGFDEYFTRGGVVVVEWADRFPRALPAERLDVRIEITGANERRLYLEGPSAARLASALQ